MANNLFLWVGGATGSTSADRFDWNISSNWLLWSKSLGYWSKNHNIVPGVYDGAMIGSSSNIEVKSPLLFGGFAGGSTGGNWYGSGTTLSTLSGLSGTTYNSHLSVLHLGSNWVGRSMYGEPLDNGKDYFTQEFNYPFPVIGGGLTGDGIEILKATNVQGMTLSDWDALVAACTTRQASLRVKTDRVILGGDQTYKYHAVNWNDYTQNDDWKDKYGEPNNSRKVYLTLVDNLSAPTATPANTIKTTVRVEGSAIELFLKDSKVITMTTGVGGKRIYDLGRPVQYMAFRAPSIQLDNCVVLSISNEEYPYLLKTYANCIIGTVTSRLARGSPGDYLVPTGITWNSDLPYHNLNGLFSTKQATISVTPGTTFPSFDDTNLLYDHNIYYFEEGSTDSAGNYTPPKYITTVVKLGNKDFTPSTGNYPVGATFAVYGAEFSGIPDHHINYPWNNSNNTFHVEIGNSGKMDTGVFRGVKIYGSNNLTNSDIVSMMNCKLGNYSYFDFTTNFGFANWRFGFINGVTYTGGLIFEDNTQNTIIGHASLRFLNYGIYGKTINTRSGAIYDVTNVSPPIKEEA